MNSCNENVLILALLGKLLYYMSYGKLAEGKYCLLRMGDNH